MMKRTTSNTLLLITAGLAAGWMAKQLFDSPQFKPQKDKVMATTKELRKRLATSDQAEVVKDIFGKSTKDVTKLYDDAKEKLISELDALKVSFDEINKQKYLGIVADIAAGLRTEKQLPEEQVEKLTRSLSRDFSRLKSHYRRVKDTRDTIAANTGEDEDNGEG
jgi:hypothetical protein